jgi:hypothetical protein
MKVGKEEIMGCLAAVETWLKMDVGKLNKEWGTRVQRIATLVETVPGVEAKVYMPEENQCPTLMISWDQKGWRYTTADCARELLEGTPSIAVLTEDNPSDVLSRKQTLPRPHRHEDKLQIVSMTLRPGEEIYRPAPAAIADPGPPAGGLTMRNLAFFCWLLLTAPVCVACEVHPVVFEGWQAQQVSNDWVQLTFVPQLGGRLMQVSFNGHPYLFVNPVYKGKYISPEEAAGRWINYGGDKIWPLPEGNDDEQHWQGASTPLDDGAYAFSVLARANGAPCVSKARPTPYGPAVHSGDQHRQRFS